MAANQNVENANEQVKKLNLQLTAAYGLGEDGYWNNQRMTPTATEKSGQMRSNPEHAYAIGNSAGRARAARPSMAQPKTTAATNPRATRYDMDIALLQDELVNNPDMSDYKKGQINDKLKTLSAKRNVLNWKATQSRKPTVEDYDAQQSYLDKEIQFAQDDMVNALGSRKVEVGDEAWYKYHDKVNELVEQRDAYNMGKMGQLDGEKADNASEQTSSGGGTRGVSLNGDDQPIHVSEDEEDGEPNGAVSSFFNNVSDAAGNVGRWIIDTVTGGLKWVQDNSENVHSHHGKPEESNLIDNIKDTVSDTGQLIFDAITGTWKWIQENSKPEHDLETTESEASSVDNISDTLGDIKDTVGNAGKWVFDAVTGGMKWVQENAETINNMQEENSNIKDTFDIDTTYIESLSEENAYDLLNNLINQRDILIKGNEPLYYFSGNKMDENQDMYKALFEQNEETINFLNGVIEGVGIHLGNKYIAYENNTYLDTNYFYESTTITNDEIAQEVMDNSILKGQPDDMLEIIRVTVDDDLTCVVGEVDEEGKTINLQSGLEEYQKKVLMANDTGNPLDFIPLPIGMVFQMLLNGFVNEKANESKKLITRAGKYTVAEVKVYSKADDMVYTFLYDRYPGGIEDEESGSTITIMPY